MHEEKTRICEQLQRQSRLMMLQHALLCPGTKIEWDLRSISVEARQQSVAAGPLPVCIIIILDVHDEAELSVPPSQSWQGSKHGSLLVLCFTKNCRCVLKSVGFLLCGSNG